MKAPEKIKIGKYNITSDGDVIFAWVTNTPDCEAIQHDVEYIRADTFIEKACEFIKERLTFNDNAWYVDGKTTLKDKVIEDFKNYMKGE